MHVQRLELRDLDDFLGYVRDLDKLVDNQHAHILKLHQALRRQTDSPVVEAWRSSKPETQLAAAGCHGCASYERSS